MSDVCKKAILANEQRNNRVTILSNGKTTSSRDSGINRGMTVDATQTKLTNKFDDPLYYGN